MGRRARLAGALTLAVLFAGSALPLLVAVARADETAAYSPPETLALEPALPEGLSTCPSAPGAYEGEDPTVGELRALRVEQVGVCEALAGREEAALHRLWWIVAEAVEAKPQRALANEKLTAVVEGLAPPVGVRVQDWTYGQPVPVEDAAGEQYSDAVVASVDAAGGATKEALWFAAGLVVALFGAYGLYRQVMPRA